MVNARPQRARGITRRTPRISECYCWVISPSILSRRLTVLMMGTHCGNDSAYSAGMRSPLYHALRQVPEPLYLEEPFHVL